MTDPTPAPARRRWQKWALLASLGLNLALAGVIVGGVVKFWHGPPPPGGLWQYARALPEPYGSDLGKALRDSRPDWIGPREALRSQRTALADALTTDPYDPANVEEVLGREPAIFLELAKRGNGLLLAQIARMSPADRLAYADALRRDKSELPPPPH